MEKAATKLINPRNCQKLTGYSWENLLSLTGIFGFHEKSEVLNGSVFKYLRCEYMNEIVHVDIETDLVQELYVTIHLNSSKIIFNNRVFSTNKLKGLSLLKIISQVQAAHRLGFQYICLTAAGNPQTWPELCGYFVWGKYGYLMANHGEKIRFRRLMNSKSRQNKILYDLLSDKPKGEDLWKNEGFEWSGIFIITSDKNNKSESTSLKILKEVSVQKGLTINVQSS